MASEDALSKVQAELDTYAATKAAFKAAIASKGLTPTDVFASYAPLIESITGGTVTVQDEKIVTFNGVSMEVGPDEGYDGIRKVILSGDPNLRGINIVDAITMYGVTGSAKVAVSEDTGLPVTKDEADEAYEEKTGEAPPEDDYMVLADGLGNITYCFFNQHSQGRYKYCSYYLPPIPCDVDRETYPYAICWYTSSNNVRTYWLKFSQTPYEFIESAKIRIYGGGPVYSYLDGGEVVWTLSEASTGDNDVNSPNLVWVSHDLYDFGGYLYEHGTIPYPAGFEIESYDPVTTEFCAKGWKRLSYHVETGEWGDLEDFTSEASTGWNYLKNIRYCSRTELYYYWVLSDILYPVWPKNKYGAGMWFYGAMMTPPIPNVDRAKYPYAYIMGTNYSLYNLYYLYFATKPIIVKEEAGSLFTRRYFICDSEVEVVKYSYEEDTPMPLEWTYRETNTYAAGEEALDAESRKWASCDLHKTTGELYLAASDPIPVPT